VWIPNVKFYQNPISSFGDETCGLTKEYDIPYTRSLLVLCSENTQILTK